MQTESSASATDQADPVTGDQEARDGVAALLNDAQILWKEHAEQLKGVGDLALLEFELSTQSLVRLVLVTLVIAGLALSAWGLINVLRAHGNGPAIRGRRIHHFQPTATVIVPPGSVTLFHIDPHMCGIPSDTLPGAHHALSQDPAKAFPPCNGMEHRRDGFHIAPGHFQAVRIGFAQDTLFIAIHNKGNEPAGLIGIHAKAVDGIR